MAVGETAKLIASLELKDKFSPTVGKVTKSLGTLDSRIDRSSSKATQFGQHLGIGIQNAAKITAIGVGILATNVALGLNSLVKLEKAQAQTEAVLKSTGQAAGITGEQVTALAEKYEGLNAIVGDEVIRGAENLLLTFTKVKSKAFEPALAAILDMNTALGKGPEGLNTTVTQVGKALNDPTKGITALRKAGVAFTDQQVAQIKALQKSGDLLGAQKIVIAELNKEFGGSFIAEGGTTGGKVAKFADAIEDLQRTLAAGFLPVVSKVADKLSLLFQDKKVIKAVEDFGTSLAGLFSDENLKTGADVLGSLFRTAQEVAPAIAAAASVTGQVVKTAVAAFTALPKELQTLLVGGLAVNKLTGGLVTNLAGGLISSVLKQLVSGVVNVNGGVVNVTGAPGLGGKGGIPPVATAAGGIGAGALVAGTAGALAIVALQEASKEAAKAFNAEFAKVDIAAHFQGALAGPQGILPGIQNLAEAIRIFGELNKPKPIPNVTRQDSRQHEGAGFRPGPAGPTPFFKPDRVDAIKAAADKTTTAVETMRGNIGTDLGNIETKVSSAGIATALAAKNAGDTTKAAVDQTKTAVATAGLLATLATTTAGITTVGAVRGVAPPIVSALRSMPTPQTFVTVNVSATHVTKSTTIQKRYGPGNGSSGQNQRSGELEY